jgi:dipeptidyl aminopeptidase/acylaminoacyl peptidase
MIVFQGDKDTLVPRKHTDCFIEEVKKKNNKVTYHVLQGEGHSIKKEAEKWCLEQEMLFFNDQLLSEN